MVHLAGVPADAPYWILAVGPVVNDQYQYAVVSDEFRITLFVLARDVQGFNSTYNDYVVNSLLPELGFSGFNGPIPIQQVGCIYEKK
jgi:lipocalin